MAVGTPYDRNAFGKGPYARATGRPYDVGAYGVGHYERYTGNIFDMAGAACIAFGVEAEAALLHQLVARTSIIFGVTALAPQISMYPWAITEIRFDLQGSAALAWDGWQPCEPGAWSPAAPCEGGTWAPPPSCNAGSWELTRLA